MAPLILALHVLAAAPAPVQAQVSAASLSNDGPEVGVPFGCGLAFPVSQAHDTGSHLQNDTYAWDFRMPEGTPITAAADGVVRLARGDSTMGGCDPAFAKFANYVVVTHANGVETQYLHFSSVAVKQGQKVKAGELLGLSGATGWACGAHLHFKVATPKGSGWNNPSVPARLVGYGDPNVNALIVAPACKAAPEMVASATPTEDKTEESVSKSVPAVAEVSEAGEAVGGSKASKKSASPATLVLRPANAVQQAGGKVGEGRVEAATAKTQGR